MINEPKDAKGEAIATIDLLCCPYCGNRAEYYAGIGYQASSICCSECPFVVEDSDMGYYALATAWNGLPRAK